MFNSYTKVTLFFALTCSFFALVVSSYIAFDAIGNYDSLPFYATFATFLIAYLLWYTFMSKNHSRKRGVFIGILTVILSHYFSWYFMLIVANIEYYIFNIPIGSLNDIPIDLISGLGYMWIYTFYSLLFFGWITIPIGAIIGGIFASINNTVYNR